MATGLRWLLSFLIRCKGRSGTTVAGEEKLRLEEGEGDGVSTTGERKLKVTLGRFEWAVGVGWLYSLLIVKVGLTLE